MARPFTRAQALQNQAFLTALARTGNIRLAARQTALKYGTVQHRRRHHPPFAQQIDAALALAHARLQSEGGRKPPRAAAPAEHGAPAYRTKGGEGVVVRRRDGKLQLRSAQPGKLTRECEQAFLAARARIDDLAPRQRDVLAGLVAGYSNKQIAQMLGISPRTIEVYRSGMMERLRAHTLAQALHIAFVAGLMPSDTMSLGNG